MSADSETGKRVFHVHFKVDAQHVLEQVAMEEDLPFGIRLGVKAVYDFLYKVSERCSKLNDPVLNKYMMLMHMYDVDEDKYGDTLDTVCREADEILKKENEEK